MVAMCTWVRARCRARSSVPRVQRWMCWCLAKMETLWVIEWILWWIRGIPRNTNVQGGDEMKWIYCSFSVFIFSRLSSLSLSNSKLYGMARSWWLQPLRLQDKSLTYDIPPPLPMPTWLTNQPITNKTEMLIVSTLLISQSEVWLNIPSANEMAVCLMQHNETFHSI